MQVVFHRHQAVLARPTTCTEATWRPDLSLASNFNNNKNKVVSAGSLSSTPSGPSQNTCNNDNYYYNYNNNKNNNVVSAGCLLSSQGSHGQTTCNEVTYPPYSTASHASNNNIVVNAGCHSSSPSGRGQSPAMRSCIVLTFCCVCTETERKR